MKTTFNGVHGDLTDLPGCSQVVVSHNVWTPESNRGKGFGKLAHTQRLSTMEEYGYDYAICTVDVTNKAELAILRDNGWAELSWFESSKTGHTVAIYGRHLNV